MSETQRLIDRAMTQAARQIRSLERTIVELQDANTKLREENAALLAANTSLDRDVDIANEAFAYERTLRLAAEAKV